MNDTSPQGVLVCDKPPALTSHGVVSRIRRWFGTRKVGHAGTLDPMATGVLVLGLGRGTKLLGYVTGVSKTYLATIRLGSATPTDDADSEPDLFADRSALSAVTEDQIRSGIAGLTGPIDQVPSAVSAIKVDGVRSYARVRSGEAVTLKARRVEVSRFDVHSFVFAQEDGHIDLEVEVDCSSGTYIRALARDLGAHLGVYGHLTALRRTRVGPFVIEDSVSIPDDLAVDPPTLIPLAEAAKAFLPSIDIDAAGAKALMQGKSIDAPQAPESGELAVTCEGRLVSIAEVRSGGQLKSLTAFAVDLAQQ